MTSSILSTTTCFPFYNSLPDDMQHLVCEYLPLEQIRHHLVYIKYYKQCSNAMSQFSVQQINTHFHLNDYFSMDLQKSTTIEKYIYRNLSNINRYAYSRKYVDDLSYANLRKIILCSKIKNDT
jgi:hypothetical protein